MDYVARSNDEVWVLSTDIFVEGITCEIIKR